MKIIKKLDNWSTNYHMKWMDFLRMILGIALIIKGLIFIVNTAALQQIMMVNFGIENMGIVYFVSFIHLITGFFILIGIATRISCLIQIPILFTALFWVNAKGGANTFEFLFSIIVFLLLCFFLVKGSGKISAYYYVANSKGSRKADESKKDYKGASINASMDHEGNLLQDNTMD